jgi:hypothetical protein
MFWERKFLQIAFVVVWEFPGQNIATAFVRDRINTIIDRMLGLLWEDPLVNARLTHS